MGLLLWPVMYRKPRPPQDGSNISKPDQSQANSLDCYSITIHFVDSSFHFFIVLCCAVVSGASPLSPIWYRKLSSKNMRVYRSPFFLSASRYSCRSASTSLNGGFIVFSLSIWLGLHVVPLLVVRVHYPPYDRESYSQEILGYIYRHKVRCF